MENAPYLVKTISKTELAMLYFPNISSESARQSFRRRLISYPDLTRELDAAHYNKFCHLLTPKQVAIIISYLGEPHQAHRARQFDHFDGLHLRQKN